MTQAGLSPLDPLVAARMLCEESDWNLSNLEIQKILYIGQVAAFGLDHIGVGFIRGEFQAWKYGPVQPTVYHALKHHRVHPIPSDSDGWRNAPKTKADPKSWSDFAEMLINQFGNMTPSRLIALTHIRGGAWDQSRNGEEFDVVIEEELLKQDFGLLFET